MVQVGFTGAITMDLLDLLSSTSIETAASTVRDYSKADTTPHRGFHPQ
jgi:hypothetical protein